jgi:hypothetical protein
MPCPNCQHDNRPGARFCDNCGYALAAPPAQPGDVTAQRLAAQRDVVVAGDTVARDKIVTIVNHLYGAAGGPAPLPLVEAAERYLTHRIDSNKTLRLQGIRAGNQPVSVQLEKVYVSLTMRDRH